MFGMSAGDIIRIVLMGIFILVCIALSIVVLSSRVCLVQSVEPLILTGAETKAVQWKENWYYLQRY